MKIFQQQFLSYITVFSLNIIRVPGWRPKCHHLKSSVKWKMLLHLFYPFHLFPSWRWNKSFISSTGKWIQSNKQKNYDPISPSTSQEKLLFTSLSSQSSGWMKGDAAALDSNTHLQRSRRTSEQADRCTKPLVYYTWDMEVDKLGTKWQSFCFVFLKSYITNTAWQRINSFAIKFEIKKINK